MKIDFGCGPFKRPGYTGIDTCAFPGVDIVYDGAAIPLPDNSVSEVYSSHCLEHVPDLAATLAELWRVSKPGAIWTIEVPHFSSCTYWYSCDHRRPFGVQSFDLFDGLLSCEDFVFIRNNIDLRRERVRLFWWSRRSLVKKRGWKRILLNAVNRVLNSAANAAPFFCDRIWCHLVGGFDCIEFRLRVVKATCEA